MYTFVRNDEDKYTARSVERSSARIMCLILSEITRVRPIRKASFSKSQNPVHVKQEVATSHKIYEFVLSHACHITYSACAP